MAEPLLESMSWKSFRELDEYPIVYLDAHYAEGSNPVAAEYRTWPGPDQPLESIVSERERCCSLSARLSEAEVHCSRSVYGGAAQSEV